MPEQEWKLNWACEQKIIQDKKLKYDKEKLNKNENFNLLTLIKI